MFLEIDAEVFLRGYADPGFGVNSTAKVIVEVSTLGHAEEKIAELQGIRLCGLKIKFSPFFIIRGMIDHRKSRLSKK